MDKPQKLVIIGNGAAALSAVKAIRKKDRFASITLISEENCYAYSPALTTYYLSQKIDKEDLFIANHRFYQDYNVDTKFGVRAEAIDPFKQVVYLKDDIVAEYDKLLIATGASAKSLDNASTDVSKYISTLRTIQDAEKIRSVTGHAKEVVVLGAGLVSLQIVNAIFKKGLKITLLISSKQILSQNIDTECAAIIQRRLESQGISLLFGREVRNVKRGRTKAHVVTSLDEELPAHLIVVGKGIKPNIEPVVNTNIKVKEGILVDPYMRTSVENIFAAGDVAEIEDSLSGGTRVMANWPSACTQGETAGLSMTGHLTKSNGFFKQNITNIFGLTIASIGISKPCNCNYQELQYADPPKEIYRKFILKNNKIVGAVLLGNIRDIGVIRNCIENGIDISQWKDKIAQESLAFGKLFFSYNSLHNIKT